MRLTKVTVKQATLRAYELGKRGKERMSRAWHRRRRPAALRALAERVREGGSSLVLADDTLAMAEHAAGQGWIDAAALDEIRRERDAALGP